MQKKCRTSKTGSTSASAHLRHRLPGLNAIDETHDGHQDILLQLAARSFTEVGRACEPRTGTQATADAAGWHQQLPKIGPGHLPTQAERNAWKTLENSKKGSQRKPVHSCRFLATSGDISCQPKPLPSCPGLAPQLRPSESAAAGRPSWPRPHTLNPQ